MGELTKETFVPEDSVAPGRAGQVFSAFSRKFMVLKGAHRELWLTFLIKLLIISITAVATERSYAHRRGVTIAVAKCETPLLTGLRSFH